MKQSLGLCIRNTRGSSDEISQARVSSNKVSETPVSNNEKDKLLQLNWATNMGTRANLFEWTKGLYRLTAYYSS
jgi:hypothetical protein